MNLLPASLLGSLLRTVHFHPPSKLPPTVLHSQFLPELGLILPYPSLHSLRPFPDSGQTFSISTAPVGTFMVKLLRTQTLPSLPRVNFFSCYHFLPDTQPPKSLSFCQILCFSYVNSSPCYCILSLGQLPSVPVFPSAKKIFHFGFLVVCLDPPHAAEL